MIQLLALVLVYLQLSFCSDDCDGSTCSNEDTTPTDRSDWMSYISDSVYMDSLSIPGTHDSGTYKMEGRPYVQTQAWDFSKQLRSGIRWFDIRLRDNLELNHGAVELGVYWSDFCKAAQDFLSAHPNEVIITSILVDTCSEASVEYFLTATEDYVLSLYTQNRIPRLGEVRGQIIIQSPCNYLGGIVSASGDDAVFQNNNFYVQAVYELKLLHAHDTKWGLIADCLEHAKNNDKYHKWHINVVPYSKIGGGWYWPWTLANRQNPRLYEAISTPQDGKSIGTITLDYPGDDLIGAIVAWNDWNKATCCFYAGKDYTGTEYCTSSNIASLPSSIDNNIESWYCTDGLFPMLYKESNYITLLHTGYCKDEVTSAGLSVANLATSIKILRCTRSDDYPSSACYFYTDSEYSGTEITIASSTGLVSSNDAISSFYCQPGSRAFLYSDSNYEGNLYITTDAERQCNFGDISGWNDVISSIRVYDWHYCCFYVDVSYGGDYFCIADDISKVPPFFNDKISSWECTSKVTAVLWTDINYSGSSLTNSAGSDVTVAPTGFADKISSIKININY